MILSSSRDRRTIWRHRLAILSPAHIDINTGFRQLRQYVLAVAAIGRKDISDAAVTRKGLYGAFGHDVDRERRRQCLDVKDVGGGRVLGTCARPSQTLRPGAFVKSPHLRIPDVRTGVRVPQRRPPIRRHVAPGKTRGRAPTPVRPPLRGAVVKPSIPPHIVHLSGFGRSMKVSSSDSCHRTFQCRPGSVLAPHGTSQAKTAVVTLQCSAKHHAFTSSICFHFARSFALVIGWTLGVLKQLVRTED